MRVSSLVVQFKGVEGRAGEGIVERCWRVLFVGLELLILRGWLWLVLEWVVGGVLFEVALDEEDAVVFFEEGSC
jgi:hypothetical protein